MKILIRDLQSSDLSKIQNKSHKFNKLFFGFIIIVGLFLGLILAISLIFRLVENRNQLNQDLAQALSTGVFSYRYLEITETQNTALIPTTDPQANWQTNTRLNLNQTTLIQAAEDNPVMIYLPGQGLLVLNAGGKAIVNPTNGYVTLTPESTFSVWGSTPTNKNWRISRGQEIWNLNLGSQGQGMIFTLDNNLYRYLWSAGISVTVDTAPEANLQINQIYALNSKKILTARNPVVAEKKVILADLLRLNSAWRRLQALNPNLTWLQTVEAQNQLAQNLLDPNQAVLAALRADNNLNLESILLKPGDTIDPLMMSPSAVPLDLRQPPESPIINSLPMGEVKLIPN